MDNSFLYSYVEGESIGCSDECIKNFYCCRQQIKEKKVFRNLNVNEICKDNFAKETFDNVPIRKLLIANIPNKVTHKRLKDRFCFYGEIEKCILKRKGAGEKSYAFITFKTVEAAAEVLVSGYNKDVSIGSQILRILPANSWNQPDSICNQNKTGKQFIFKDEESVTTCKNYAVVDEALINKLNNDCLMQIFIHLPFFDRIKIERVCKRWQLVVKESWCLQKKLDLVQSNWGINCKILAPLIYKILLYCGQHLTHIDLSKNNSMLGNSTLLAIANLCPNIQSIDLRYYNFQPSAIKALAKNCTNITNFHVTSASLIRNFSINECEEEFSLLFLQNRKLKKITIDFSVISNTCLLYLPTKSIQEMILINLKNFSISNILFQAIQKMINLETLVVRGVYTSNNSESTTKFINVLPNLSNLKRINFSKSKFVNDDFLIALSKKCKQLKNINISGCKLVTNAGLASITSLPKLECLNINDLVKITDEVLIDMPNLKSLYCCNCINIHNVGLITLIRMSDNIEMINVNKCKYITNELIDAAVGITKTRRHKMLRIYVKNTAVKINEIKESSPFLEVMNEIEK